MSKIVEYNKLVRNKILEIITAAGNVPHHRIYAQEERSAAIKQKLVEEATELAKAESEVKVYKELADLHEIIDALKKVLQIDPEKLIIIQAERREERGGFDEYICLESVEEMDGYSE